MICLESLGGLYGRAGLPEVAAEIASLAAQRRSPRAGPDAQLSRYLATFDVEDLYENKHFHLVVKNIHALAEKVRSSQHAHTLRGPPPTGRAARSIGLRSVGRPPPSQGRTPLTASVSRHKYAKCTDETWREDEQIYTHTGLCTKRIQCKVSTNALRSG